MLRTVIDYRSLFYTDECCDDRNLLMKIFKVDEEGHTLNVIIEEKELQNKINLDRLTFPDGKCPGYIYSENNNATTLAFDRFQVSC